MFFEKKALQEAVTVAESLATTGGSHPILRTVRVFPAGGQKIAFIGNDGSNGISWCADAEAVDPIDVCVDAARLKAVVNACHSKEKISFKIVRGSLTISQPQGPKVKLEVENVNDFPLTLGFEEMEEIYSGPNPHAGLDALKHEAITHAGTTPLFNCVVFTEGAAYAMRPGITVRCDFSLIDRKTKFIPLTITMGAVAVFRHFEESIRCLADANRLLVVGDKGYAILRKAAVDVGKFPDEAKLIFGSLHHRGGIRLATAKALPVVNAAVSVLRPMDPNTPLYMTLTTHEDHVVLHGIVGRQEYEESIPAICQGAYRIPIQAERLLSFLKSSSDEQIAIKVMNSDKIPDPLKFVHLVDSRLHEAVGISRGKIEELKPGVLSDAD